MVGAWSLSSGAHSRDPVALPTLRNTVKADVRTYVECAEFRRRRRAHDRKFGMGSERLSQFE
jgi:hypothetical protein